MGCTSSVPNMSDLHSNTTENGKNEVKNEDDLKIMDTNEQKDSEQTESTNVECNENKTLPTFDNLEENLQLDRKLNSSPEFVMNEERDVPDNTEINLMENEKDIPSIELEDEHHTISTFKEVVDKLVLDSILNDIANMPGVKDDTQNDDKTNEEDVMQDNQNEIKNDNISIELEELEAIIDDDENLDETASPSQSECSRATRWEALADIAAELPPSLAVDPVTGQIFSLAK